MKKLLIALLPVFLAVSCKKNLSEININPKAPQNVPSETLFASAEKNFTDLLTSSNVNVNIFRLIVQYWTETTYTDESNFDLNTRQIPRQIWNGLYRDVINNLRYVKKNVATEMLSANQQENAAIVKNRQAQAEILEIMAWYYLVTTFGDIPYTEALNVENPQPKYDNQRTIYMDLLSRMDAAIANLNASYAGFGSSDLVYGGSVSAWKKFANSFKLKMGITIADSDPAKAKSVAESAVAAGVFTSSADNAQFNYLSAPPNTNPIWVDLVQSGRKDFVVTRTVVDLLQSLNDPRLDDYFTFDASGTSYSGGTPGASNNYATFSKPSARITDPTAPALLMSYYEVEFFLAEAAQRGYNVPGTAALHYQNAVTASILWWGGTTAQATAYLAQPAVVYNPAMWQQRIGIQKYLALYNRGWEEWIEWRRLDYPQLVKPSSAMSVIPLRFTYPVPEQNVNTTNYKAAVTAMGGQDLVSTKLFWDKQ